MQPINSSRLGLQCPGHRVLLGAYWHTLIEAELFPFKARVNKMLMIAQEYSMRFLHVICCLNEALRLRNLLNIFVPSNELSVSSCWLWTPFIPPVSSPDLPVWNADSRQQRANEAPQRCWPDKIGGRALLFHCSFDWLIYFVILFIFYLFLKSHSASVKKIHWFKKKLPILLITFVTVLVSVSQVYLHKEHSTFG